MNTRAARLVGCTGAAIVASTTACVEERAVLDVALEPVLAAAVADDVDDDASIGFAWVDEDGAGDGLGARAGEGFALLPTTTQLSFSVRVDTADFSRMVALGRTGFLAVRSDDDVAVQEVTARVLLAPVDRVGRMVDVPVPLGGDECVVGDEAGRLFVIGGSAGNQGGYVVDDFAVQGLSGAERWTRVPVAGCGASSGRVAAVAGCGAPGAIVVVAGQDAREVSLLALERAGAPVSCAAQAAPVAGGVWLADGASLFFVDDDGAVVSTTTAQVPQSGGPAFAALSVTAAGDAVVVDGAGDGAVLRVVARDGAARDVRAGVGASARLGRRFGDVVLLDGAVLVDVDGVVVRDDVGAELSAADVVGFTVLSNDTVVALAPGQVRVSAAQTTTMTFSAPPRSGLAALPGDTVVFAGGGEAGVDVVALGDHRVWSSSSR
jgi:hypothetical protein